jgi:hypothetical protein
VESSQPLSSQSSQTSMTENESCVLSYNVEETSENTLKIIHNIAFCLVPYFMTDGLSFLPAKGKWQWTENRPWRQKQYCHIHGMTVYGLWIVNRIYCILLDIAHDCTLQITHEVVPTVTSSLPPSSN